MEKSYLDENLTSFYRQVGDNYRTAFIRGQFFWTHVLYLQENLEFWRPINYDETQTSASNFSITSSTHDAFNRRAPLYEPPLEINEEFLVVKAKRRPIVLLSPIAEEIKVPLIRGRGKVHKNTCIVAPLFSVEDKYGNAKYHPEFVNRIRQLEFPHLFFIPAYPLQSIRNSICRLDCIQAYLQNHLNPLDLQFNEEILKIFQGQTRFYLTETYEGDYQYWREGCQGNI